MGEGKGWCPKRTSDAAPRPPATSPALQAPAPGVACAARRTMPRSAAAERAIAGARMPAPGDGSGRYAGRLYAQKLRR